MKLYVWENVLEDYSCGIMFAYAKNVEQARELIEKSVGFHHSDMDKEPRIIRTAEGFHVFGSS